MPSITEAVMEGMANWQSRPLDGVYQVVFTARARFSVR
jgi:transposase-like protein